MKIVDNYVFFWQGELSNFYPCKIKYEGHTFKSSEQLFMYMKAQFFNDEENAENILNAKTPKEAKSYGRLVKNYSDRAWNNVRIDKMREAVYEKFSQNEFLKSYLLDKKFYNKMFVEASPYDKIWGIGMGEDNPHLMEKEKWGTNYLGDVLYAVRDDLIED